MKLQTTGNRYEICKTNDGKEYNLQKSKREKNVVQYNLTSTAVASSAFHTFKKLF